MLRATTSPFNVFVSLLNVCILFLLVCRFPFQVLSFSQFGRFGQRAGWDTPWLSLVCHLPQMVCEAPLWTID
jgi:hypothetical protein